MFYKYRLSDNRILVAAPAPLVCDIEIEAVVELEDSSAYDDPTNTWRMTSTFDGVEVDPTWTPPPFDLSTKELIEILKLILKQINVLRTAAGLSEITYAQARDAIKAELGL